MVNKPFYSALFLMGTLLFVLGLSSCDEQKPEDLGENSWVSDCLSANTSDDVSITRPESSQTTQLLAEQAGDANIQCADEKLSWTYDQTTGRVSFVNNNVWLNCCGEHSILIILNEESDTYIIEEVDEPLMTENGPDRCLCECFFDFKVELPEVMTSAIRVRLTREITDADSPKETVWEGELELTAGQGEILIAEDVGWCSA